MMSRIFGENLKKNNMMLFELLPFLNFVLCKCDILESIIGRHMVEARNFYQLVEYNKKILW